MAKYTKNTDREILTTLGKETVLKGNLRFSKPLKIDGKFEGEIQSEGYLYIEEGAEVHADIKVRSVTIGGTVHGNITAEERLEMLPTSKVFGNVRTAQLRIADEVIFEGKCEMIKNPDSTDVFSAPRDELKKSVKRL
ncbi:MAG: polymer-forming cytoskeletal protein [Spirochaetia bacterium]